MSLGCIYWILANLCWIASRTSGLLWPANSVATAQGSMSPIRTSRLVTSWRRLSLKALTPHLVAL